MDMAWDAIVVGAGPAGISAATAIHHLGGRVLLIDKKKFPRPKACAGMLSPLAITHAPFIPTAAICAASSLLHWKKNQKIQTFQERNLLSHRIELDYLMYYQAIHHGIPFQQDTLRKIRHYEDKIQLITAQRRLLECKTLIACDGANSTTRHLLGLPKPTHAFAIETDIALPCNAQLQAAVFDYDAIPNGYAWWFPKGKISNIGVYIHDIALLEKGWEERLRQFQRAYSLNAPIIGKTKGATIGVYGENTLLSNGSVLFCGDAAGLAIPFTGEGISYAFLSGKLAGQAVMQTPTSPSVTYQESMDPILAFIAKQRNPI